MARKVITSLCLSVVSIFATNAQTTVWYPLETPEGFRATSLYRPTSPIFLEGRDGDVEPAVVVNGYHPTAAPFATLTESGVFQQLAGDAPFVSGEQFEFQGNTYAVGGTADYKGGFWRKTSSSWERLPLSDTFNTVTDHGEPWRYSVTEDYVFFGGSFGNIAFDGNAAGSATPVGDFDAYGNMTLTGALEVPGGYIMPYRSRRGSATANDPYGFAFVNEAFDYVDSSWNWAIRNSELPFSNTGTVGALLSEGKDTLYVGSRALNFLDGVNPENGGIFRCTQDTCEALYLIDLHSMAWYQNDPSTQKLVLVKDWVNAGPGEPFSLLDLRTGTVEPFGPAVEDAYIDRTLRLGATYDYWNGEHFLIAGGGYLELEDGTLASGVSTLETFRVTGIASPEMFGSVTLFPNPAVHTMSITGDDIAKVTIYTTQGALAEIHLGTGSRTDISVTHLPQGTYFVQLESSSGQKSKAFPLVVTH